MPRGFKLKDLIGSILEGTYITEKQPVELKDLLFSKSRLPKALFFQKVIIEWWQEY